MVRRENGGRIVDELAGLDQLVVDFLDGDGNFIMSFCKEGMGLDQACEAGGGQAEGANPKYSQGN
jgi:hypothetical protein